ncbi:hypothetical protein [Paraburkholderia sp. J63]|uniref:hypothetical protein n=1 Tax=Paraburkholderia sp. J63 TaxID=2805434 RepID=UPI002ABD4255|nr:hypothetical protein [Paraburkholderia sp. J63]
MKDRIVALLFAMLPVAQAMAAQQEECVGRYRLTLPSEAEIAMTTAKAFIDGQVAPIRFADGLSAPLSSFVHNGAFDISKAVSPSDFDALVKRAKDELAASATKPYADQRYTALAVNDAQSFAWKGAKDSGFLYL